MSAATELVFVSGYHNLPGISEGYWIEYYTPATFDRFRFDFKRYIEQQLEMFSESYDYEEYFSLADYGDEISEFIDDDEEAAFRSALRPIDSPLDDLSSREKLNGFQAVILKRVDSGNLAEIRRGVKLFNWIVEAATDAVDDRNPGSCIWVETTGEFGPTFIDRLLNSVESLEKPEQGWHRTPHSWRGYPYPNYVAEKFVPLKPILNMVQPMVRHERWPHSDLAIGKLLLLVQYVTHVLEEEALLWPVVA